MGVLAAALTGLWAVLIVSLNSHAEALCAAMPHLALTLGLAFAGVAFLIGESPGDHAAGP